MRRQLQRLQPVLMRRQLQRLQPVLMRRQLQQLQLQQLQLQQLQPVSIFLHIARLPRVPINQLHLQLPPVVPQLLLIVQDIYLLRLLLVLRVLLKPRKYLNLML